ncbi:MAG TPA: ATP-binding protein, partial [Planctomycetaceae bacterium]|nr:ATP-binding protein [Planctomycetaceae bacterium]
MTSRFPLAHRLVPAALRGDPVLHRRALSVVVFDLAMLFWVPVYVVIFAALDAPVSARIVAAAGVLMIGNLFLLQGRRSAALCGHALTAICWCTYTALTAMNGGHNSPPAWWHATVPAFAVVLLGRRGGLAWLCASAAAILAFYVARIQGIEFPCEATPAGMRFLEFSALLGLLFCLFILTFSFKLVEQNALRTIHRALERAQAADRAKSQFLANMSHEIRTPMTAILGYTELLFDRSFDPAAARDALATIKRNGDHLLTIINDILDLSKIEAGRLVVERTSTSLRQIVDQVVDLMRGRAEVKGLRFVTRWIEPLPLFVETDPTRLRQILLNLVGNAIKFTEHGSVELEVRSTEGEGPGLIFTVRDTGIGMTGEQLERLYQPFMQADDSMTRRFGGTGLGLAITHRLVELLAGSITVASEPGIGSTFVLRMPMTSPSTAPGSESNAGDRLSISTDSLPNNAP